MLDPLCIIYVQLFRNESLCDQKYRCFRMINFAENTNQIITDVR